MRKFLLIVAMLLLAAAPAMATVTVRATQTSPAIAGGAYTAGRFCNVIDINYARDSELVRAFALEVTLDNGFTFTNITDFNVSESNTTKKGYGIFPGKFRDFINPALPNWADGNYNPIAPTTDADACGTGIGTNKVILELGTLFVGETNRPPSTGTLCKLWVNPNKFGVSDCNVTLVVNGTRGGIVLEDGSTVASPTLLAQGLVTAGKISFPDCWPCWQPYDVNYNGTWVANLKPKCWCGIYANDGNNWNYNCYGDGDAKTELGAKYRVYLSDYNKLVANWQKRASALKSNIYGYCVDFDHMPELGAKYRVYLSDYNILTANWQKRDSTLKTFPPCPLKW